MNTKSNLSLLTQGSMIAAIYVILTLLAASFGLDRYAIQIRFSEALTILPFLTPAAIPGLFVGCLLSNIITGCAIWDIIFGPLATLIGAYGTRLLRRHSKWLAPIPPIVSNTIIIPFVLMYAYKIEGSLPYFMLTVGLGELISCGFLGMLLLHALQKNKRKLF